MSQGVHPNVRVFRDRFAEELKTDSWKERHDSIGEHYRQTGCKICVEIVLARGDLARYLLQVSPNITELIHSLVAMMPKTG